MIYDLDSPCVLVSTIPSVPVLGIVSLRHRHDYIISSFFRSQLIAIRTGYLHLIVKRKHFEIRQTREAKDSSFVESSFHLCCSHETELSKIIGSPLTSRFRGLSGRPPLPSGCYASCCLPRLHNHLFHCIPLFLHPLGVLFYPTSLSLNVGICQSLIIIYPQRSQHSCCHPDLALELILNTSNPLQEISTCTSLSSQIQYI